jgi:hypothetical protein
LEAAILEKVNSGQSARLTAGFCWKWSKELGPDGTLIKDVQIGDFQRPWNAPPDMKGLPKSIPASDYWAYDPNGSGQVGCIYTAQGFEFDYVGVIIGKDLVYRFDKNQWIGQPENSFDGQVKKSKANFDQLVKNTYRVLLTRGMKGCYVYFMDEDTEKFFRGRME